MHTHTCSHAGAHAHAHTHTHTHPPHTHTHRHTQTHTHTHHTHIASASFHGLLQYDPDNMMPLFLVIVNSAISLSLYFRFGDVSLALKNFSSGSALFNIIAILIRQLKCIIKDYSSQVQLVTNKVFRVGSC